MHLDCLCPLYSRILVSAQRYRSRAITIGSNDRPIPVKLVSRLAVGKTGEVQVVKVVNYFLEYTNTMIHKDHDQQRNTIPPRKTSIYELSVQEFRLILLRKHTVL